MQRTIDGQTLRHAMRQVPSPVTVVTAGTTDEIRGITIGSFTSVSLDPPLISFNVARDAQMHDLIVEAEHFAVHLLSDAQAHLSNQFAIPDRSGAEQFADVPYRLGAQGTPVLSGALAVFHCIRYAVYPAGDHSLLVGEVVGLEDGEEGGPLLYFNRGYRTVGEEAQVMRFEPVKAGSNASS